MIDEAPARVYPTEAPDPSQVTPETMVPESQWEAARAQEGGNAPEAAGQGAAASEAAGQKAAASETAEASSQEAAASEQAEASGQAEAAPEQPAGQAQPASAAGYQVYVVNPGETLYGICFKLYQNLSFLEEICRVNGLTDQNSIYAGQELLVP